MLSEPGEPYELYERVELFETGETDEQQLALQGGFTGVRRGN
jgi:hypothetical protein